MYTIENIDLLIRETPPSRMTFSLGKQTGKPKSSFRRANAIGHVRLQLRDDRGRQSFGCSGDRLSFGWLDKRPNRSSIEKLRALVDLVYRSREIYLEAPSFKAPFEKVFTSHKAVMDAGRSLDHEDLTASYASALMERAILDAVCRMEQKTAFQMVTENRIGFRPEGIHPELTGFPILNSLPKRPRTEFIIRHTVGISDPITAADHAEDQRVNDGEPETLEEFVREQGVYYFKVKISGNATFDLDRLSRIWDALPKHPELVVTLDGNEAYEDLGEFAGFVDSLERDQIGLFQHMLFIEQPLTRRLTHDPKSKPWIDRMSKKMPLVIDEADGTLDSFKKAYALGYRGTSHKNCKSFYKSLTNFSLIAYLESKDQHAFMSGEDLGNLPIVPLHQDFAALGILDIEHCERNGHHYQFGLSHLTAKEKDDIANHHTDLYVKRGDEWFLNIQNGKVQCPSLQCPGFGVCTEPDWQEMIEMKAWLKKFYPE